VGVAIFFDLEKAYDMMGKGGLLIKLDSMGVGGRVFNWINDFLFGRSIQASVVSCMSESYEVDNGTPPGKCD
jgi:hypothetical protein